MHLKIDTKPSESEEEEIGENKDHILKYGDLSPSCTGSQISKK